MMEIITRLVFGLYLLVILGGAGLAVFSANLVRAFVGMVATLLGAAGLYLLMQSPFLAFMQLLIYVGAICVLIFFALMLTNAYQGGDESAPAPLSKFARSLLAGLAPLVLLLPTVLLHPVAAKEKPEATPLAELGKVLLEEYTVPFELISIILLIAMAGGVFLAWERRNR